MGVDMLCVADEGNDASKVLARQNARPKRLFMRVAEFEQGKGFCEATHKEDQVLPDASGEHLFTFCFCAAGFQATNPKKMGADASLKTYKIARGHIQKRKPPLALLEVADWGEHVPVRHQREVLDRILGEEEPWGLGALNGYRVEILELRLEERARAGTGAAGGSSWRARTARPRRRCRPRRASRAGSPPVCLARRRRSCCSSAVTTLRASAPRRWCGRSKSQRSGRPAPTRSS
ncbi:unnamed protein product [Prorocentrum cordatum]|uniref:Uncharacterized protein n=1 Tax=Prorocentrum cordatum TaxID=2364126 RepID=A0ABN9Y1F7_9DINO|nr:unnamed protein product [Polarella glacialis]